MNLSPKNPNTLVRARSFEEISGGEYSSTDYGLGKGMLATSLATMDRNFITLIADSAKKRYETSQMEDGKYLPVTPKQYEESPAATLGLEFRANESPITFERRVQKKARLDYYNEITQGQNRAVTNLITGVATGMVTDPTNWLGFGVGAGVKKGAMYAAAGRGAAASYHTAKGTFKNILGYSAATEVPYAMMQIDQGIEDYTWDQVTTTVGMTGIFAGTIAAGSAIRANKTASVVRKAEGDYATFTKIMDGTESPIESGFNHAYENGRKALKKFINSSTRLTDIAEGRVPSKDITVKDFMDMSAVTHMHESHLVMTGLNAKLSASYLAKARENKEGIVVTNREFKLSSKRITDAVLKGKTDNLTEADVTFLKENNIEIREAGDTASTVRGEADPNISPSIFKQEKDGTISNLSDLGEQPSVQDLFTYIKSSAEASGNTTTLAAVQRYLPALENIAGERIRIKQGSAEELNKLGVAAYFDSSNNTITVPKSGVSLDVFLHEVVHGLTVNRIDSVLGSGIDVGNYSGLATLLTGGKSITKPIHQLGKKQFLRYLDELDQKISKSPDDPLAPLVGAYTLLARLAEAKVKGKGMVSRTLTGVHGEKTTYGYSNLKEFLAEFVSNESFRNNVAEIYRQAATSADPKIIKLLDTHFSGSRKKVYGTNVKELISRLLATIKSLLLRDKGLNDIAVSSSVTKGLRDPRKVLQDVTVNNKYKASDLTNQTEKAVTGISDQINTLFGSLKKQDIRANNSPSSISAKNIITKDKGLTTNSEIGATVTLYEASLKARNLEEKLLDARKTNDPAKIAKAEKEVEAAAKVVEDFIGETFFETVQQASKIVNEIMFGVDDAIPVTISKQPVGKKLNVTENTPKGASGLAAGWSVSNELMNYIAQPHIIFSEVFDAKLKERVPVDSQIPFNEGVFTKVMSTLFHESWHTLKKHDNDSYKKLLNLASQPSVKDAMLATIKQRGYKDAKGFDSFMVESPSHLLEFALTRPEFWSAIKNDEPALYAKYSKTIEELLKYAARLLKQEGYDNLFSGIKNPEEVAIQVGSVINELRKKSSVQGQINKVYGGESVFIEPAANQPKQIFQKAAYENPNLKSRAAEQDKYMADPAKYLEDTINNLLGDDSILPLLGRENIAGLTRDEINIYIANTRKKLDDMGYNYLSGYVETITQNLLGMEKRRTKVVKILKSASEQEDIVARLADLKKAGAPLELTQRIGFILLDETLGKGEKMGRVNKYMHEENLAMILRFVHDGAISDKLNLIVKSKKTPAQKLAQLKTVLDGSLRKDVDRDTSIQRKIDAQTIKDQSPIIEFLVNNDLLEVFLGEDPSSYMSSYRDAALKNPKIAEIYGRNLKEASLQMHLDLMEAISTGEIPKRLEGLEYFEKLVDIIKTVNRGQMAEINHLGVNIRDSKNFSGYSMKYDRNVIAAMSEAEFVSYMLKVLDVDSTTRLHGGVMQGKSGGKKAKDIKATPEPFVKFEINQFLARMYNEIKSGKFEDLGDGETSAVGSMRKTAKLAYKEQFKTEALIKLGNYDNLGRLLLGQIRGRSERIALVKNLGHDPYNMIIGAAREAGLTNQKGFNILDATAKQVTGMLDNPVDVKIANTAQNLRKSSNVLFLGGSGISTLSDIPMILSTLQYINGDVNFRNFIAAYKEAIATQFAGKNKDMAAWYRSQGAGFDLITRQMAQRTVSGESVTGGWLGKANDIMFELNGLNRATAAHQQLFIDLITNSMGEQFRAKKLTETLKARMMEFGFTEKELMALSKYVVKTADGKYRLGSSNIPNAKLQQKLSGFLVSYMKEGVLEPDAGAQAISRLGLQAGEIDGEVARTALQYTSFPLGMSRVVYRRFMHGYKGEQAHNAFKMAHLATYIGTALAFGYMATILKDLSKGKEPIDPLDMTSFELSRIIRQSGIPGIAEMGMNVAQFGPASVLSPVGGTVVDIAKGDFKKAAKPLTGEQYPVVGPVMTKAIAFVMGETTQNIQTDLSGRAEAAANEKR